MIVNNSIFFFIPILPFSLTYPSLSFRVSPSPIIRVSSSLVPCPPERTPRRWTWGDDDGGQIAFSERSAMAEKDLWFAISNHRDPSAAFTPWLCRHGSALFSGIVSFSSDLRSATAVRSCFLRYAMSDEDLRFAIRDWHWQQGDDVCGNGDVDDERDCGGEATACFWVRERRGIFGYLCFLFFKYAIIYYPYNLCYNNLL